MNRGFLPSILIDKSFLKLHYKEHRIGYRKLLWMDLTRVFGMNNGNAAADAFGADPIFRAGNFGSVNPQQPLPPLTQAFRQAADAINGVQRESEAYKEAEAALVGQIEALQRAVDAVQAHHQTVVAERDQFQTLLASAEGRLAEVQRVVQRYTIVQEPVVASDGFTYERRVIKQYLDECMRSGVSPVSQQTQSELTSTLIPNQSLKKLVELLKSAKPQDSTPVQASSPSAASASAPATAKSENPPTKTTGAQNGDSRLHPCVRVYGYCNYKDTCTYAQYPYDACLSHLKGKCRFGAQCHELHVDFRGPTGVPAPRKKE